jgi:hypothetical protein
MPVDWMLAVLRDPEAEQNRRDLMAIQSAPYCHAKLNAVAVSSHSHSNRTRSDENVLQIYAVPRGGKIEKDGTITVDGELTPVEPFKGTPALTDQRDQPKPEPIERERFEAREAAVPENVTVLNPHGRRQRDDDSEDEGGPGAA